MGNDYIIWTGEWCFQSELTRILKLICKNRLLEETPVIEFVHRAVTVTDTVLQNLPFVLPSNLAQKLPHVSSP